MFLATAIFSSTTMTFWDLLLFFFLVIPAVILWFFCIFDIFGRHDLGGGAKVLWLAFVLLIPWIGALSYLFTRPSDESRVSTT